MRRPVDMGSWSRKAVFDFYGGVSNPFYMVTFRQDVTDVYSFAKRNGLSFYLCLMHLVSRAVNQVEAFRYSVRDGELFLLDKRSPSFTDLAEGSDTFRIVTMPDLEDNIFAFCKTAEELRRNQTVFLNPAAETDELIYISCLPWFDLTALTNERDLSTKETREDNIPRISWGKYVSCSRKKELGLSVEVNHRFIDGIHLGMFKKALDAMIRNLPVNI